MVTPSSIDFITVIAASGGLMFVFIPAHCQLNACWWHLSFPEMRLRIPHPQECMTECMTVAVEESCVAEVVQRMRDIVHDDRTSTDCESSCTTSCVDNCTDDDYDLERASCKDLCLGRLPNQTVDEAACGSATHKGPCGRCAKFNCDKRCEARCGDDPDPRSLRR